MPKIGEENVIGKGREIAIENDDFGKRRKDLRGIQPAKAKTILLISQLKAKETKNRQAKKVKRIARLASRFLVVES